MPIGHAKLPVRDIDRSRDFYVAVLAAFGWRLVADREAVIGFGFGDGGAEDEPIAFERSRVPVARCHIAFAARSRAQVDEFHAAGLAAGGSDNGGPGERPYGAHYYAAFVLDPDGHNIEAVHKGP